MRVKLEIWSTIPEILGSVVAVVVFHRRVRAEAIGGENLRLGEEERAILAQHLDARAICIFRRYVIFAKLELEMVKEWIVWWGDWGGISMLKQRFLLHE